jgi:serine phosphatase RsbU (regulator of sigma subunit)
VLFGEQRLATLIGQLAGQPAEDVVQRIDEAVVEFAPGLPDDDVAILAARVTAGARITSGGRSAAPATGTHRD